MQCFSFLDPIRLYGPGQNIFGAVCVVVELITYHQTYTGKSVYRRNAVGCNLLAVPGASTFTSVRKRVSAQGGAAV